MPDSTPSKPILCRMSPRSKWFCAGLHLATIEFVPDCTFPQTVLCRIVPSPKLFCAGSYLPPNCFVPDRTLPQTVLCRIVPPKLHKIIVFGVLLPKPNLSFLSQKRPQNGDNSLCLMMMSFSTKPYWIIGNQSSHFFSGVSIQSFPHSWQVLCRMSSSSSTNCSASSVVNFVHTTPSQSKVLNFWRRIAD